MEWIPENQLYFVLAYHENNVPSEISCYEGDGITESSVSMREI